MARLHEVVITCDKCERHIGLSQNVCKLKSKLSIEANVEQHRVEVMLCEFLSRELNRMCNTGHSITDLSGHLLNYQCN